MSADPTPINTALDAALRYAAAGYRVFPCREGQKVPATSHGFKDASVEVAAIRRMFFNPRFNIGLACGPQPSGVNLLAIDVDAHKGGLDTWRALTEQQAALGAPSHETPNGGLHVFFDAPEGFRNTQQRLGAGIDTRGADGYVVVPPSRFDGRRYVALRESALLTNVPPAAPGWLLTALQDVPLPPAAPKSPPRVLSGVVDEDLSPADWVRLHGDWVAELERFGWVHAHGEYWVRPGKNPRDGHSAVLHDGVAGDRAFVVFTTDVPSELERLGRRTADGAGFTVSLFDLIAAYEFDGDRASAAREIRRSMPKPPRPAEGIGVAEAPAAVPTLGRDVPAVATVAALNLPAGFWEARPILAHIRTAAQARLVSPDGLLANCLARSATLIPPSLRLPPIVGGDATFDFLSCVVAETSGGKSITSAVAKDLLPDPQLGLHEEDRTIMFDRPVGSGEGIAQAFMVPEVKEDEDGKRKATGRQVVGKQALHLVVDESTGLVAQAQRKGTTIIPTLLSAWSGATLGNQNASAETRRIIDGGRCRVAAVLNMQSSNAWMLFTEEMTTLGLTSRMLFSSAHDPNATDETVPWPGVLRFQVPPTHTAGTVYVTYDDEIALQITQERRLVLRHGVADKSTGHTSLLRCKVAAILAVWEGRKHVTVDDWDLAGNVCSISGSVLEHLAELRAGQQRAQRHAAAEIRGETEAVVDDAKERRAVAKLAETIAYKADNEGVGRRQLMKATTSSATRHRFDAALALAIQMGKVKVVDGRIFRA